MEEGGRKIFWSATVVNVISCADIRRLGYEEIKKKEILKKNFFEFFQKKFFDPH